MHFEESFSKKENGELRIKLKEDPSALSLSAELAEVVEPVEIRKCRVAGKTNQLANSVPQSVSVGIDEERHFRSLQLHPGDHLAQIRSYRHLQSIVDHQKQHQNTYLTREKILGEI